MEDKTKRVFAEQLNQNQLLWHLLDQFEADAVEQWKRTMDPIEQAQCHAKVKALETIYVEIKNELSRLMGRDNARSTDAAA